MCRCVGVSMSVVSVGVGVGGRYPITGCFGLACSHTAHAQCTRSNILRRTRRREEERVTSHVGDVTRRSEARLTARGLWRANRRGITESHRTTDALSIVYPYREHESNGCREMSLFQNTPN